MPTVRAVCGVSHFQVVKTHNCKHKAGRTYASGTGCVNKTEPLFGGASEKFEEKMRELLHLLFGPRFHFVEEYQEACVVANRHDPFHLPMTEDGVVWRGYDVRKLGIEKIAERP
jgi:hypothetical protein